MIKRDRPRMPNAIRAGDLIRQVLESRGMASRVREYRAWEVWERAVGPQVAKNARPGRIRDGVLEVRVPHPTWMQQLQLMKPQILARLNNCLGGEVIRDLWLHRSRPAQPNDEAPSPPARPVEQRPLTDQERIFIEETLRPLEDPELRERLRVLYSLQACVKPSPPQEKDDSPS